MRRRLRLLDMPRLYRRGLAREGRRAVADGRGYARFRLRGQTEFAVIVPNQGARRPRRAQDDDTRAPSVIEIISGRRGFILFPCRADHARQSPSPTYLNGRTSLD